ncbi:MAG: hypothetical protein M1813_004406 [Trichoglossum hirsutum]|nr:MAG: hypothetical protein M1813_004406 [Trichoglossum hirsutum]
MLLSQAPPTLLSLFTILLASTHRTSATPYRRDISEDIEEPAVLVDRACAIPCGWQSQLCCAANQQCYTDGAGQAQCGAVTANAQVTSAQGVWQYYTSTFVETDLVTRVSVYSTYVVIAPAPTASAAGGPNCNYAHLETPCGSICCAAGQICQVLGQCVASGAGTSQFYSSYYNTYSVPLRPTSGGATTITSLLAPTATVPFQTPIGTAGGIVYGAAPASGGLSGGAIAGIVIGVLAGIILLLLICFYCCLRAGFDGILSIFGLGPRRRTSETIIEEHHHHSGGGWFGRPSGRIDTDKPSGIGWGGMAAALAALAVFLGLKRRHSSYDGKSSYETYTTTSYDTSETLALPVDGREPLVVMGLTVAGRIGRKTGKSTQNGHDHIVTWGRLFSIVSFGFYPCPRDGAAWVAFQLYDFRSLMKEFTGYESRRRRKSIMRE